MKLKKGMLILVVGIILANMCFVMKIFFPKELKIKCHNQQEKECMKPYSRPEWLYTGATTVVKRPLPTDSFKPQPNLNMSKISLPLSCNVYVPSGIISNNSFDSIYATISNTVAVANKMLADKKYSIWYYSSVTTLYQKDENNFAVWYINTAGKNILSIKFVKYEDKEFLMLNLSEGYEIIFKPDGELYMFSTMDNSLSLRCEQQDWGERPYYICYCNRISPYCTKVMTFSKEGQLVEEKVEDSRNFPSPF